MNPRERRSSGRHARAVGALLALAVSVAVADAQAQAPPTSAPAAPAAAPAPAPRAAGRGLVVVALGTGAEDASRALAREVYVDPDLRPPIDEVTAQVLTGGAAPAGSPPAADRAALRAALDPDPGNPATRRALDSLATELGATGVLAVHLGPDGATRARLIRAGAPDAAGVDLVARVDAAAGTTWPGALTTLRSLVGVVAEPTPPAAGTPPPGGGARAKPATAAPAAPAAAGEPSGSEEFYERPWFWVALGAFAAAGLTALVVSATADGEDPSDTVRFRATIPQARLTFP